MRAAIVRTERKTAGAIDGVAGVALAGVTLAE